MKTIDEQFEELKEMVEAQPKASFDYIFKLQVVKQLGRIATALESLNDRETDRSIRRMSRGERD